MNVFVLISVATCINSASPECANMWVPSASSGAPLAHPRAAETIRAVFGSEKSCQAALEAAKNIADQLDAQEKQSGATSTWSRSYKCVEMPVTP